MAKKGPYDFDLNYRTEKEIENAIIWCIVILLSTYIVKDTVQMFRIIILLVAGAAATLIINARN
ncbi:MAG: hypothetical protein J7J92_03125 [Candidatus Aenigmarchaeota archaeon]|nr:hypothetical protein [Candidatus Aenigmarchaeota archaeon]